MNTKPALTCVYVDYGACTTPVERGGTQATPEVIERILSLETRNKDTIKKLFYDHRGIEHEQDWQQALNLVLETWHRMNYETLACPRVGVNRKELIDPMMMERIYHDMSIFGKAFDLHVVLVVGDVDFRPLIIELLDRGITVSIIATQKHATLHQDITKRLKSCYALFPVAKGEDYLFKSLPVALSQHGGDRTFQANYHPSEAEFFEAKRLGDSTYTECPFCHELFPTGHISNHSCDTIEANNPAPGLMTLPHLQALGITFSRFSPQKLIETLLVYFHRQVQEEEIDRIFEMTPIIPWQTVEIALLLFQMSTTKDLPFMSLETEQLRFFSHVGIIERNGDGYSITDRIRAVRRLIEEVHHRNAFPSTARLYSPDGALQESELRRQLIDSLHQTQYEADFDPQRSADELWDSDTALHHLTHPAFDPDERELLVASVDAVHTLQFWNKRLRAISQDPRTDILTMAEMVTSESSSNFVTRQSIQILISNNILKLNAKEEILSINTKHPFFRPLAFEKAVA